jgi:CheY-like chemotaxis protein|tara:strand:+ start:2616 stop:2972 length:357 start_codon:yes stop_codon:yes gene_type:complete
VIIFLADDDPIQNMLTTQLVKVNNDQASILVYNNGKELIDGLEEGIEPDIIFLDINMPIMDGWEFLNLYSVYSKQAKVYMLTSSTNDIDLERANNFKCVEGYFSKPMDKETMRMILSS